MKFSLYTNEKIAEVENLTDAILMAKILSERAMPIMDIVSSMTGELLLTYKNGQIDYMSYDIASWR